jgi:hypothetical protein
MTSIAQKTQTSQAKKTDFKEKSLSQLTFSGASNLFNRRYSTNLTSLKHNVLSGSFDTNKRNYCRIYSKKYNKENYVFLYKKKLLDSYFPGEPTTNLDIEYLLMLEMYPSNRDRISLAEFAKINNLTKQNVRKKFRKLSRKNILNIGDDFSYKKKQEKYITFSEKFKQFRNEVARGNIEIRLKMSKCLMMNEELSKPAKIIYTAIDNLCNSNNYFFYERDKLNMMAFEGQKLSQDYHRKLLKELEEVGYIQKQKGNIYYICQRMARKPREHPSLKLSRMFQEQKQTKSNTIYKNKKNNNYYSYKCNYSRNNNTIKFFDLENKEHIFEFITSEKKFEIIYDKEKRERLEDYLRMLTLYDFTRLFCWIYGINKSFKSQENKKNCYFYKIKELINHALEGEYSNRENLIIAAWCHSQLNSQKSAISWLKEGKFLNNRKRVAGENNIKLLEINKLFDYWHIRIGHKKIEQEEATQNTQPVEEQEDFKPVTLEEMQKIKEEIEKEELNSISAIQERQKSNNIFF